MGAAAAGGGGDGGTPWLKYIGIGCGVLFLLSCCTSTGCWLMSGGLQMLTSM